MPRRDYEDDRPSRRRYRDEDDDDLPRPRSRRRYEDDDYNDRPRRRKSGGSNSLPLILILIALGAGSVLLLLVGVGGYIYLRPARPAQQAPAPQWAGMPPPGNPMPMNPPAGPGGPPPAPIIPPALMPVEPGKQVAISNLRVQRGIGGRSELVFNYTFAAGRPIGLYTAVVTEPGGQPATADLHFLEQSGTISLSSFGPFGGTFRSGTTVYIGNHAIGFRNLPAPISNTLTLP
jgi:hypothetical protein